MSKKASNPPPPQSKAQDHIDLLGRKATDKVTGFKGVITSVSFDLYGCVQVIITPVVDKDGKNADSCWYDITRLTVGKSKSVMELPNFCSGYIAEGRSGGFDKPIQ